MKLLLLILLPFASFCQLKKKKITTPKYHDSTYYETQYDTTFGTMEYYVPNGTVKGNGAIVKMSTWKMNITIPQRPIQYIIKNKDTVGATLSSGAFGFEVSSYIKGLIKTKKGYKDVFEKYTFIPD